jgi:hypothetical protein
VVEKVEVAANNRAARRFDGPADPVEQVEFELLQVRRDKERDLRGVN